jgi:iron(III) transport system permease protein
MSVSVPAVVPITRPLHTRISPLLWLPAFAVASCTVLPVVYLAVRAAGAGEGIWELIVSARTARLVVSTLGLAAAVTATTIVLALPAAWLTIRTDLPGGRVWSVLTALPLVVPSYVGGFVIATALGPTGMLQRSLEHATGIQRLPDIYGFPGAWLTLSLFTYPYVLLSVRAGLRGLDPAIEEASRSLGYSSWMTFRRVTLPLLRPWIGAGALLVALYTLSDFGAVSMMQFESFTTAIYVQYQASFNRNYAAALALVLVAITALLLMLEARQGRARYHRISAATAKRSRRVALGAWRWPALIFCAALVALGVLLPAGVISYWFITGMQHGEPLGVTLRLMINSIYAAALGAAVTVAAAVPVAVVAARAGGTAGNLVGRLAYAGYALPGIVVALSLVFFGARYAPALYQTLGLLVFAYMILYLPQAVGTVRSAVQQVSPSQEEAARTLGRSAANVLWTVTLPQIRPGILAGAALVFLTTMKELPATLLLSPTGFQTLATRIWSAATEGFFARAAAPALLLLVISSLSIALVLSQERRPAELEETRL